MAQLEIILEKDQFVKQDFAFPDRLNAMPNGILLKTKNDAVIQSYYLGVPLPPPPLA